MKLQDFAKKFAFWEFIIGLIVGLLFAIIVALYISRLPADFLRSSDNNNRKVEIADDWDPNKAIVKNNAKNDEQYESNPNQDVNNNYNDINDQEKTTIDPATLPDKPTEDIIGKILREVSPTNKDNSKEANRNSNDVIGNILKGNSGDNSYVVQVGAFKSKSQAQKLAKELETPTIRLNVVESSFRNETIYRVRTASMNYNQALQVNTSLSNAGVSANIIKIN